jgi:cytochrome c oxidase subunit 4
MAHIAPVRLLVTVFVALVILTIMTLTLAGNVGPFGFLVAMTLATIKGLLVMLFFMHMYWDKMFNIMAFATSFLFVTLFIGMTLLDSSHYQDDIDRFPRQPEPAPAAPAAQPH